MKASSPKAPGKGREIGNHCWRIGVRPRGIGSGCELSGSGVDGLENFGGGANCCIWGSTVLCGVRIWFAVFLPMPEDRGVVWAWHRQHPLTVSVLGITMNENMSSRDERGPCRTVYAVRRTSGETGVGRGRKAWT